MADIVIVLTIVRGVGSDPATLLLAPAVVAAVVSAVVALVTVGLNARRVRLDRQRELFADAFAAIQAYKEFPYMIRRRRSDSEREADRSDLTKQLSAVQQSLNEFRGRLRVEAPRVGDSYTRLCRQVRQVAGAEISRSWSLPPVEGDNVGIEDIDLSPLEQAEDEFLLASEGHLTLKARLNGLWKRNPKKADSGVNQRA